MSEVERLPERHRDLDRFLTFVDAVVAIAITLLVLPLADLGSELGDGTTVKHLLSEHQSQIWAFLLSFAVISDLWFVQHRALRPVMVLTSAVARLMVLWMLTIVVLPFLTELVAKASHEVLTRVLYFAAMILGQGSLALIQVIAARHPEMTDGSPIVGLRRAWVSVAVLVAGLLLTAAFPALSYYPLLLLAANRRFERIDDYVERRRHSGARRRA